MKLNKIATIALAALFMTACSDDDSFNTDANVTVEMGDATYTVRESGNIFYLPIVVLGESNGPIQVTVETTPSGESTAEEDVNYSVTQKTIIIPKGANKGVIEIQPIDNEEENDPRYFDVKIVKAEGAKIGEMATTVVEIKDNDQDPYEKLTGKWTMKATSVFQDGTDGPFDVTISAPDDEYYGHELYATFAYSGIPMYMTLSYAYDEANDVISLTIEPDMLACNSVINFGSFKGVLVAYTNYDRTGAEVGSPEPLVVTRDTKGNVTSLTPENANAMWLLGVYQYTTTITNTFKGYLEGWAGIELVR